MLATGYAGEQTLRDEVSVRGRKADDIESANLASRRNVTLMASSGRFTENIHARSKPERDLPARRRDVPRLERVLDRPVI